MTKEMILFTGESRVHMDAELRGVFNTFRLGAKWKKLSPGEIVDLGFVEDDGSSSLIGQAIVVLPPLYMSYFEAKTRGLVDQNHAFNTLTHVEPKPDFLLAILERIYPGFTEESYVTVVYLQRIGDATGCDDVQLSLKTRTRLVGPDTEHIDGIVQEVVQERVRQAEKYGHGHDDSLNKPSDWMAIMQHYGARWLDVTKYPLSRITVDKFRKAMIETAAIAIAAVQSIDRQRARHKRTFYEVAPYKDQIAQEN